jgi:hypothetical protein
MREGLITLAAAAGAWAVGVSGVATNRPFGFFLFALALFLFLAAHKEQWLSHQWTQLSRPWRLGAVGAAVVVLAFGGYLAINFNEAPPQSGLTIDSGARDQISSLRTEVASLQGEVKAAIDFQQREKEQREAKERKDAEERTKAEQRVAQSRQRIQLALNTLSDYRAQWNRYLVKAASVCVKDQIGTLPTEFTQLSRSTTAAIEAAGFPEYQADFTDNTRCPPTGLSQTCSVRGSFNDEAVVFFSSARCRISNLGSIIDKLRASDGSRELR